MAWTYANWRAQATPATRLTYLELHITEVSEKVSADYSTSAGSKSAGSLLTYLDHLTRERDKLEAITGTSSGAQRAVFTRGRPIP